MRVLMVEPGKEPYTSEIDDDLKGLQNAVDGLIEVVYLEETILLVCNEEGKCLGLEGNRRVDNGDIIAGTFLICGGNDEGEMISLIDEQIEKYSKRFKEPEYYSDKEVEDSIFIEVLAGDYDDEMET